MLFTSRASTTLAVPCLKLSSGLSVHSGSTSGSKLIVSSDLPSRCCSQDDQSGPAIFSGARPREIC